MATGLASSVQGLVQALGVAFARAELPPDSLTTPVKHLDLPWQCPPLHTALKFERTDLQDYFDYPLACMPEDFYLWWVETLNTMYLSPERLIARGTYDNTARVFRGARLGSRAFRFAVPQGFPNILEPLAPLTFSIEAARAAYVSLPTKAYVRDCDNYYVELLDGHVIGVVQGEPADGPHFNIKANGYVDEVANAWRGEVEYNCHFDALAKARSLLFEHEKRFVEFEAMDMALQALRFMCLGAPAPNVLQSMLAVRQEMPVRQENIRLLKDSLSYLELDIPDRAKLLQLHGTLVPRVISPTYFRMRYYAGPPFPFTALPEKMERIRVDLEAKLAKLEGK